MNQFQLINNGVLDKGAIQSPIVVVTLQAEEVLPFGLLAEKQLRLAICDDADLALLDAAPDGVVYELDVTFYLLKDVALGAVAGNIIFEHSSKVVAHKVDGRVYYNNVMQPAFNPNALLVNAFTNPLGLANAGLTS